MKIDPSFSHMSFPHMSFPRAFSGNPAGIHPQHQSCHSECLHHARRCSKRKKSSILSRDTLLLPYRRVRLIENQLPVLVDFLGSGASNPPQHIWQDMTPRIPRFLGMTGTPHLPIHIHPPSSAIPLLTSVTARQLHRRGSLLEPSNPFPLSVFITFDKN
jgi:hypothetical protein